MTGTGCYNPRLMHRKSTALRLILPALVFLAWLVADAQAAEEAVRSEAPGMNLFQAAVEVSQAAGEGYATATDLADWLVRSLNIPFRQAHHITGSIVAAASAGLLLGGASYLKNGGPLALPFMFAIDAAIIGAGVAWLIKVHAKRN